MQQMRKINSSHDFGPLVEEFNATEALNAFYVDNSWDCRYQQIGKGPLRVEVASRMMENLGVGAESVSQRLWGHARSGAGMISVIFALTDADIAINGLRLDQDRLFIIPPNESMDIVLGQGAYPVTMLVAVDMYESYRAGNGGNEAAPGINKIAVIDVGREDLDPIRRLALGILHKKPNQEAVSGLEDAVVEELLRLVENHESDVLIRDPYFRLRKHDNILRVIEYIHEHLAETISIETICEIYGVSPSTLERRFRKFLDVTPVQYILAARLNRARRDILDPLKFDLSIAEIAMQYHLLHMGRFSHNYKDLFGRLPSAERDIAMSGA